MTNANIDRYGDKFWLNAASQQHRTDGPAIEYANGSKSWYINGQLHRDDGPAIELADGHKSWWINNQRHRDDGPAVECVDGYNSWWINGEELSEQEFNTYKKSLVNILKL